MEILLYGLAIVGLIIVAQVMQGFMSRMPLPLIEIALGLIVGILVPRLALQQFDSNLFMMAVVAPLMFNEGQNTSRRALSRNLVNVLMLAVVLVVITVIGVSGLVSWIKPEYSFWSVFILAAILSPTDATAVSGLTANLTIPERLMQLLEGESLFNDATGIVILNFGLAVIASGKVAIQQGVETFFITFLGGILVGVIGGYLIVWIRIWLQQRGIDHSGVMVPIHLMTPFVVYLIAEAFDVSGILAVVATGLIHGLERDHLQMMATRMIVVTNTVWQVVTDLLNGVVFVLLGLSLPLAFRDSKDWPAYIGIAFVLYLLMLAVRWLFIRFTLTLPLQMTRSRASSLLTLFGSHGTVTMALALSLPATLVFRQQVVLIAALVVLFSLVVPTLVAPSLLPPAPTMIGPDFSTARKNMLEETASWMMHQGGESVARQRVVSTLREQTGDRMRANRTLTRQLMAQAQDVEIQAISDQVAAGKLPSYAASGYQRYLNANMQLNQRGVVRRWFQNIIWQVFSVPLRRRIRRTREQMTDENRQEIVKKRDLIVQLEQIGYEAAMRWLKQQERTPEANVIASFYQQRHNRFVANDDLNAEENSLYVMAFQYEYQYVDTQLRAKQLSTEVANALREQISYDEMVYMQQQN
ncbi:cation:proton antiporter [Lacticaseibacillus saniviri]|uniref:Na(+) H(+) antiporter n=1 Tax=Lacticaseibacillus saniviri JCM 17471 = DSM 24301 TaxID=1293598 RepID=A0A0R2MZZ2_9LACO|nr:sodium:proton antiporter [Lacticaseibacillus saniviri]KRO17835.1 Na(+) H(+) antiporter [Lacticaseibacillus saniviri JCM 17471 = DSM 24301]MCG4282084.1 sodium:proton antiporter [Lacticaseibacillus saniviri]